MICVHRTYTHASTHLKIANENVAVKFMIDEDVQQNEMWRATFDVYTLKFHQQPGFLQQVK